MRAAARRGHDVKKPDKTTSDSKSETPQDKTALMLKKDAAAPGVIPRTDIGAGDGAKAAATGGEIRPIESTLLGDKTGQNPPAGKKPARNRAAAEPKDAPKEARPAPVQDTPAPVPARPRRPHGPR